MRIRVLASLSAASAAVVLVATLAACAPDTQRRIVEGATEELGDSAFYTPPSMVSPGRPGDIERQQEIFSAPAGSQAWRVLYHSVDAFGKDILVSGLVVTPSGAPVGGKRVVVSWAHPTTGAAARCAPSVGLDPFDTIEGLADLLARGYTVAATDYPGMGLPGPSSYLIGASEAHSVLDIARAAANIPAAHASDRVLLWGHSQGGQAVVFAAEEAAAYAPDLHVLAAGVAAPAVDLATLLDDDIGTVSGVTIGSYAFTAYADAYDVPLESILTAWASAVVPSMAQLCLLGQNAQLHTLASPLVGSFLASDPKTTPPWDQILAENTPGSVRLQMPLFVAQGETDTLVHPSATAAFVARECGLGTNVQYLSIPKTGHGLVALKALNELLPFLSEAVEGRMPNSTC